VAGPSSAPSARHRMQGRAYKAVERRIFWLIFAVLGLVADFILPLWWALFATIPICILSWWVAYRSDWF
jgi:hypothetical protein